MRENTLLEDGYAVSEVVGTALLVLIAVITFSVIFTYVFPLPIPPPEPNIKLMGYVNNDGAAVIEHMGGESLKDYKIVVSELNGTLVDTTTYSDNENPWTIGECRYPKIAAPLLRDDDQVRIIIYSRSDDGSEHCIFDSILNGRINFNHFLTYMLITNLRTNSTEEDLICFNYLMKLNISATYIYNWMIKYNWMAEAQPLNQILFSFDTNSSTSVKDYSGNGYNGTINDATWTENGVVGGAYYFGGSKDHIRTSLPAVFNDMTRNDFTVSLWLNSTDITAQHRVAVEGGNDKNFFIITQINSQLHFGVVEYGADGKTVTRSVRSEDLLSNTWYHVACTWDASQKSQAIFINGVKSTEPGNRSFSQGTQNNLAIGHGTTSSRFWYGYIDEFQIFDRVLSDEQIYQIYISAKDGLTDNRVIVSEETNSGETWQCVVTPNDGTQDYDSVASNLLNIINYPGGS